MQARSARIIEGAGRRVMEFFAYLGEVLIIVGYGLVPLTAGWKRWRPVCRRVLALQFKFTGMEAIGPIALLALVTALCVVVQVQLLRIGQNEMLYGPLLVAVLVRELGPLLTAFVVIARSGTAIAAEVAHMRVSGELDALRLAGIDVFHYVVVPRLGGVALAMLCLGQLFMAAALAGAWACGRLVLDSPHSAGEFMTMIAGNLEPTDALIVLAKTIVPGLLIAGIVCREGLACTGTHTEVPRVSTRATVRACTAVFVWDGLVTVMVFNL